MFGPLIDVIGMAINMDYRKRKMPAAPKKNWRKDNDGKKKAISRNQCSQSRRWAYICMPQWRDAHFVTNSQLHVEEDVDDGRMTTEQLNECGEALSILSAKSSVIKERDELQALLEQNLQSEKACCDDLLPSLQI
jgi:hypothetical protein